ncbi:3-deoxy-manno-octulosonate cytidylyltransferase [Alphaproteobacteria bacterium]|nr:3-deoxy-manno-octulosonate cytidylyltransferase [Alphaproteobacteria bacterium]
MLSDKSKACVIIPARYESSRFPGKPLVTLLGKPMILWVAELSALAVNKEHVYVATDDMRIVDKVREAGFSALMTSSDALTGTDRLAEAARMLEYDIYVNVQGDEPLVNPSDIRRCIEIKTQYPNQIVNGYCWMNADEDPANVNVPKIISNENERLVYISRAPLPAYKDKKNAPKQFKKQVCIYGFSRGDLEAFSSFGKKSKLEQAEDIEILRFFEINREVHMYECSAGSLAVDVPEDVKRVEQALRAKA